MDKGRLEGSFLSNGDKEAGVDWVARVARVPKNEHNGFSLEVWQIEGNNCHSGG